MSQPNGSVLQLHDIHRSYGWNKKVLEGVNLEVNRGEVVGLVGRNGTGKTTLLRIAMAMLTPHKGNVRVFGEDPWERPVEVKRRVGYVSEDQILPSYMRAGNVIAIHRSLYPTWDVALERQLSEKLGIDLKQKIRSLSKGQARKLALLCAVAHSPELLILDEPAGGLDPVARQEFLETAIELLVNRGTSIVFSSHQMSDIERIASRVAVLHRNRIILDEPVDTLRESFTLAVFDRAASLAVQNHEGYFSARKVGERLHVIFRGKPSQMESELKKQFLQAQVVCSGMNLEELFIEVVGGGQ